MTDHRQFVERTLLPDDCFQCEEDIDPRWIVRIITEEGTRLCFHIQKLAELQKSGNSPFVFSARDNQQLSTLYNNWFKVRKQPIPEHRPRKRQRVRRPAVQFFDNALEEAKQEVEESEENKSDISSEVEEEIASAPLWIEEEGITPEHWKTEKCGVDPISQDEIPADRQIRLRLKGNLQCYDVLELYKWLQIESTEPGSRTFFSPAQLDRITKKYREVSGDKNAEKLTFIRKQRVPRKEQEEMDLEHALRLSREEEEEHRLRMQPNERNMIVAQLLEHGASPEEIERAIRGD